MLEGGEERDRKRKRDGDRETETKKESEPRNKSAGQEPFVGVLIDPRDGLIWDLCWSGRIRGTEKAGCLTCDLT